MGQGGGISETDNTAVLRMIQDEIKRASKKSMSSGGVGAGGFSYSGSISSIITPPTTPVALSPWFQDELAVPNNSTDTIDFGLTTAVDAVNIFYYAQRGAFAAGAVETGFIQIWHDGASNAFIATSEAGDDIGIAFTVTAAGTLILTCTADASGSATAVKLLYSKEGLSAGAVFGTYKATRDAKIEVGRWGVAQDGAAAFDYRAANGDDCGLTFAGSIVSGVLTLSVAADASDLFDTAVTLTYVIVGADGTIEWRREALAVPDNGSASATFERPTDGEISWSNTTLVVAASDSETFQFGAGIGCVHGYYYVIRKTTLEIGQFRVWNDAGAGKEWRSALVGDCDLTFTGVISGSQLALTIAAGAVFPESANVVIVWSTEEVLP